MKQNFQFVRDQRVVLGEKAVLLVDLMGLPRWEQGGLFLTKQPVHICDSLGDVVR